MIDILLVEDDKEICFILTELLKRNHYNVSAYHNGIEAIEALSSKKYDLMLLDLMLPDLPGEKILFHLKKHNNSIPVIVISAKNQPEIRINLLRSGADDYITKPFYHEEVLARIESVLRRCSESPQTEYSFKDMGYTLSKLYDVELLHRQALKLRTYIEDALYPYIALQDCLVVDMERIEDTPIIYNTITQKVYENGQWSKQDLDLHGKLLIYVKSSPPMPAATEQINNGF